VPLTVAQPSDTGGCATLISDTGSGGISGSGTRDRLRARAKRPVAVTWRARAKEVC
jgi:hypothetical protein